ncbi:unnamed protein product [Schistocephalus solidus]|uniref:Uncharacterized protein n=1 Tax=Schistocephalus solidus TaxID=70667 RepID=A0A183SYR1_SCHSO|nr:unnamed protein product [Schistocephalus solidus]
MPAPRPRVHPLGLLPRLKAEGVSQQEMVFCTRSQKKEAAIVTDNETVRTQHSLQGSVVCPDAVIDANKDNQEGVQFVVEFVLRRIKARPWGNVGTDDGGELVSPKRQA